MVLRREFSFLREVQALTTDGDQRTVSLSDGSIIRTRSVVIATGVDYRRLGVPTLEDLVGRGVFYGAAVAEAPSMAGTEVSSSAAATRPARPPSTWPASPAT